MGGYILISVLNNLLYLFTYFISVKHAIKERCFSQYFNILHLALQLLCDLLWVLTSRHRIHKFSSQFNFLPDYVWPDGFFKVLIVCSKLFYSAVLFSPFGCLCLLGWLDCR